MRYKTLSIPLIIILLISVSIFLYAGAVIVNFRGEASSNKVTLYWSTLSETDCNGFQIERSLNENDFKKVGFIEAAGTSSTRRDYTFVDKTIFKSDISRTFHYRLKIIHSDNTESIYSQTVSMTPAISGARYTWGSIKALFR